MAGEEGESGAWRFDGVGVARAVRCFRRREGGRMRILGLRAAGTWGPAMLWPMRGMRPMGVWLCESMTGASRWRVCRS